MKVLSLFDGMSCGQIALRELGVPIDRYYASEIDKHAIAQTRLNFPDTIQLGDVEKWREWNIEWEEIDLLLAGSPCQGFSLAGKMLGHDDPRSRLYWVFLDILHHVQKLNPNVKYLLENVRMRPADEVRINESLGIRPVVINSALVSAQNRVRLYWSNIRTKSEGLWGELLTDIPQPADRGIYIGDILDDEVDEKYYMRNLPLPPQQDKDPWIAKNLRSPDEKSNALLSTSYKGARANGMTLVVAVGSLRFFGGVEFRRMKTMKSPCLNAQSREDGNNQTVVELAVGTWRTHKVDGGFREIAGGKAPCIPARARNDGSGQPVAKIGCMLRRLTPTECARLQTIPDWYKWGCSDTQAYKMLGNGWTVEVIKHILSHIIK
uniref:Cytosine specific methyltransferase n=1 Tax=Siphoviridae sp. ctfYP22 TaxID=2827584 RepID=A0A8S5LIQ5_9CAUD|nr:MAG TPA: Cytosine specific methyltransferase [Siphoviridae sp. ctfYP22]